MTSLLDRIGIEARSAEPSNVLRTLAVAAQWVLAAAVLIAAMIVRYG